MGVCSCEYIKFALMGHFLHASHTWDSFYLFHSSFLHIHKQLIHSFKNMNETECSI
jgi:hypothetical protein